MNREEIICMAKAAGWQNTALLQADLPGLTKFAVLVAAAEREECAKLCESLFDPDDDSCNEADLCVAAIRARGQK